MAMEPVEANNQVEASSRESAPQQEQRADVLPQEYVSIATKYAGPIPPPSLLRGYKDIDESLPDRIFTEFEKNSAHIREQEHMALEASIKEKWQGQWMAFVVSMTLLAIMMYSLYTENYVFAGSSGVMYVGFIVVSFLSSKNVMITKHFPKQNDKTDTHQ